MDLVNFECFQSMSFEDINLKLNFECAKENIDVFSFVDISNLPLE